MAFHTLHWASVAARLVSETPFFSSVKVLLDCSPTLAGGFCQITQSLLVVGPISSLLRFGTTPSVICGGKWAKLIKFEASKNTNELQANATGNTTLTGLAGRSFNWCTYVLQVDNQTLIGPVDQSNWISTGLRLPKYAFDTLAAIPAWVS